MMQRRAGKWQQRYEAAQVARLARGLDLLRPGRAAQLLIRRDQHERRAA